MALNKAIAAGKEHRKQYIGKNHYSHFKTGCVILK